MFPPTSQAIPGLAICYFIFSTTDREVGVSGVEAPEAILKRAPQHCSHRVSRVNGKIDDDGVTTVVSRNAAPPGSKGVPTTSSVKLRKSFGGSKLVIAVKKLTTRVPMKAMFEMKNSNVIGMVHCW